MEKQREQNAMKVVLSNEVNQLADKLGEELFCSLPHPFQNRLVVVPHLSLKEYLQRRFIAHPRLKIAGGVKILTLNQAVMEVLDNQLRKRVPSFLELSLSIEEKLQNTKWFAQYPSLQTYFGVDTEEKKKRRIATLSDELARLFTRYGIYGLRFLPAWLAEEGWQQALWKEIFAVDSLWTYPLALLNTVQIPSFSGKIVLFGFSYLPSAYLLFFNNFSASLYSHSPCALYWEDVVSDKERLFFKRALEKKGVKAGVRAQWEHFLEQSHPLLGNWGKLGKEMLKSLEPFTLLEEDAYVEPQGNSLLCQLKRSLLTYDETEVLTADASIQIHSASSKLREVEALRDTLETLLQQHSAQNDPILPSEILVVSPAMASYAPYIQMVFADHTFSYAIEGVPLEWVSETVQGFLQLFKLTEERFALSSVCKLLHHSSFMQKHGFALDEIHRLTKWLKTAHIRERLSGTPNSWEAGIERLLSGLAILPNQESDFDAWPNACIPQSDIDLFNRFLVLFEALKSDFSHINSQMKSASDWLHFFLHCAERYFVIDWESEPFFQELRVLSFSCCALGAQEWSFESIKRVLSHLAQKAAGSISSSQLQRITFTSLSAGHLRPARIVWCLGLDEGVFPRNETRSSLCEISKHPNADYFVSKTEEDRFLFLELLLQAQDYLLFSYQRLHAEDGKHQRPSLLIEELNHYVQRRGILQGLQEYEHPAFPFDQRYFSQEFPIKKWKPTDYLAAQTHYLFRQELQPTSFFVTKRVEASKEKEIVINMRQLKKLARHPLQFYFNETLKIYLKEEEDEEETEFLFSHLRKALLRKKSLGRSLPQMIRQLQAQGKMPHGLFQQVAIQELEEELQDLKQALLVFGIQAEEVKTLHLSHACTDPKEKEHYVPPLVIPLKGERVAYITGTLEDITPQGLLYNGDSDLKGLLKVWPLYLVYCCLQGKESPLLLTKKKISHCIPIDNPQEALASYLEYFLLARQSPSPLMPEWAKTFFEGAEEGFKAAMMKAASFDDPYLDYLKRRQTFLDPAQTLAVWLSSLREVFKYLADNKY